jgi:hypothetical protein
MKLTRRSLTLGLTAALKPLLGAAVPRPAGEFEYFLDGNKRALISAHKGKVVVIEFGLTT